MFVGINQRLKHFIIYFIPILVVI